MISQRKWCFVLSWWRALVGRLLENFQIMFWNLFTTRDFLHVTIECVYRQLKIQRSRSQKNYRWIFRIKRHSGAIPQKGNTSQEEKHMSFTKNVIYAIRHHLKIANSEQMLFRPSVLDTELHIRVLSSHHTYSPHKPYGRQNYTRTFRGREIMWI